MSEILGLIIEILALLIGYLVLYVIAVLLFCFIVFAICGAVGETKLWRAVARSFQTKDLSS